MVCAEKWSSLFPLRRFCSVANLKFKYLGLHVFLFLLSIMKARYFWYDRNRYYENVRK